MRRLLGVAGVLLGVGLATGCTLDDYDAPRPLEERSRDRTRAALREVAADAVREQFGALPAPQQESELRCDSAKWYRDTRAYVLQGVWDLPLAPEYHERTLRALYQGSRLNSDFEAHGDGRFTVRGYDPEKSIGYSVTSGEAPATVRVWASSACFLEPE